MLIFCFWISLFLCSVRVSGLYLNDLWKCFHEAFKVEQLTDVNAFHFGFILLCFFESCDTGLVWLCFKLVSSAGLLHEVIFEAGHDGGCHSGVKRVFTYDSDSF